MININVIILSDYVYVKLNCNLDNIDGIEVCILLYKIQFTVCSSVVFIFSVMDLVTCKYWPYNICNLIAINDCQPRF